MSQLIVFGFDREFTAEEVYLTLMKKISDQHGVALENSAMIAKNQAGKIKLQPGGAASSGFWGLFIGSLLLMPMLGGVLGAATDIINSTLTEIGVHDDFMQALAATLQPNTSALFILLDTDAPDLILSEIAPFNPQMLQTTLSQDVAEKLEKALVAAHS